MNRLTFPLAFAFLLALLSPLDLHAQGEGIQGQKAPKLQVPDWIQVPDPAEGGTNFSDLSGKYVVMLFFQSTCEACHKRAFPTLKRLVDKFEGSDKIVFMAVQTPFEDFSDNTVDKLQVTADEFDLDIPFGHLAKTPGFYSLNDAYKTGGTPWWVIVDPDGIVEYNGFFLNPDEAEKNFEDVLAGREISVD